MSIGAAITVSGDNVTIEQGVYAMLSGSKVEVIKKSAVSKIALSADETFLTIVTDRPLLVCHEPGREPDGILWVESFNGQAYTSAADLYNAMVAAW